VKPKVRAVTPALIGFACAAVMAAAGVAYWATGPRGPAAAVVQRPPMSVLVADFTNATKEPVFEGTLESALVLALEDASFVSSYSRRAAQRIAASLSDGAVLQEANARLVAKREGINVVVAGSVALEDDVYVLAVRALDGSSGRELSAARAEARSKDHVLGAISSVAASIRRSLGDATPESAMRGVETFTASSLEAAHAYEEAQQTQRAGDTDGAIMAYRRAIELDPGLGRAYAGLAATYANAGQREEADKNYKLALTKIDRMTERERFRTRAGYYLFSRNPHGAIEQLEALVQKFPADVNERGNLAFAWFLTRNMGKALEIGRSVTALSPKDVLQRGNVALYAMYAGDFDTSVKEAEEALKLNESYAMAMVALAVSHLGSGRVSEAESVYERLRSVDPSIAAQGMADTALYQGRVEEAAAILEQGAAADIRKNNILARARKLTALARARAMQARPADAARLAKEATSISGAFEVRVEAGLVYVGAGMVKEAAALADMLRASLQPDPQAYAFVLDGFIRLARKQPREAVDAFAAAQKISDTWLGRFGVGRAYLELSAFPEAQAAFDACLRRRGEATALFLDDLPTYSAFPPTYYYMGLAQKGLGSTGAAESFQTFLDIKQRGHDPLVSLAREHIAP
jgi:eukaryotic-like serine/threonine-protein kinase